MSPLLAIIENGLVAEELRREALAVLATVAQNNPYAQDALMSQGALPIFVRIADSSASASTDAAADAAADASAPATPASNQLRLKALHAMSCLARGNTAAEAALVSAEVRGVETLESCLATDFIRLQRKATFVTSALILSDDADAAALAAYYGRLAPILVAQAETSGDIDLRENTVKALTTFANRGFGESIKEVGGHACIAPHTHRRTAATPPRRHAAMPPRRHAAKPLQVANHNTTRPHACLDTPRPHHDLNPTLSRLLGVRCSP